MSNPPFNQAVSDLLDALQHPLRPEIEALRTILLTEVPGLTENVKWNGPNYCWEGQDRITMKVMPPKQIQLIFHRGAKVLAPLDGHLVADAAGLLDWKSNDRGLVAFKRMEEIEARREDLVDLVRDWIEAAG